MIEQAKNIKVGQKIIWGTITLIVESIQVGSFKNGKKTITFFGNGSKSLGRKIKPIILQDYDFTINQNTKLRIEAV